MKQHLHHRYPGIRSFETEESAMFFGRSRETRELHRLVKVEPAVVLFAKSGIGKSSLLHAGLFPLLADEYSCICLRFQDSAISPAEVLIQALKANIESFSFGEMMQKRLHDWCGNRTPTIWEQLKAAEMVMDFIPSKPLLVLEHFEEFFVHDLTQQDFFTEAIADLIFGRVPQAIQQLLLNKKDLGLRDEQWATPLNWKVIITIRSEHLSLLDNLSHHIPPILENRYQLFPFNKEQAKEAIVLPAASDLSDFCSPIFNYSAEALELLLDALSNEKGEIESFQLQIICRHIEELVLQQKISTVAPEHLGKIGDIRAIWDNYYDNCIALLQTNQAQEAARDLIEKGLIDGSSRRCLDEATIEKHYHISPEQLEKIENTGLLKSRNGNSCKVYEIAHDTLVLPILNAHENRKAQEREAIIEKEKRALYAEAEKERNKRHLSNMLTMGAGVLAFVAIGVGIWAWLNGTKLSEKVKEEETLRTQAEEKSTKIEEALNSLATQNAEHFWVLSQEAEEIIELSICPKDFLDKMRDISKAYSDSSRFNIQIELLEKEIKSKNIKCD